MTNTASGVLVAMSGGVDSSTAAALLLDEGHKVVGATMKLLEESGQFAPPPDSFGRSCCSASDFLDAKNVALKLNIDHQIHNFSSIFKDKVIERFISSYLSGLTPNPCVDCNRFVKFGLLLERAGLLGCDRLATGHYARIVFDPASKRHLLKK
ncbi:MAG: tRNA 2-thiouridine(34) synthase MnmA, partial [Deltaproteobacteria bacterium]|nr:tRNA 2-thiouridine(34) synthase MnmA [Deltaproteobacteria bacterium]